MTKETAMTTRKITGAIALTGLMLLGSMAAAWACTALATIEVKPSAGVSGQQVSGAGYGFHGGTWAGPSPQPVEVRWQTANGPVLASVLPTPSGNVKFSFTLPDGAPGYYTVIASQKDPSGKQVNGGPARATIALNNPPKQAVPGADEASTVVQQTPGEGAPSAVVHHAAPAPKAPAAQAPPVLRQRPVPVIRPSGSRASDILAPVRGGSASTPILPMMMVGLGAGALVLAGGAAALAARARRAGAHAPGHRPLS